MDQNPEEALQQRLHEVSRQREQFQQAEVELRAQFIARSEVIRMQNGFDEQSKQHAEIVSSLQVFLNLARSVHSAFGVSKKRRWGLLLNATIRLPSLYKHPIFVESQEEQAVCMVGCLEIHVCIFDRVKFRNESSKYVIWSNSLKRESESSM